MSTETLISVLFLNLQNNKDILKSLNHFRATLCRLKCYESTDTDRARNAT